MIALIFLNFLRFLTDAAIYYSFAGFFALKAGGGNILPGLLIPAVCFGLSRIFAGSEVIGDEAASDSAGPGCPLQSPRFFRQLPLFQRFLPSRRFLPFLCLLPCLLCLIPGFSFPAFPSLTFSFPAFSGPSAADGIAAIPPVLYAYLLVYRRDYTLSAYRQNDVFGFFWKAYLIFAVLCILFGQSSDLASGSLPAAVCAMTFCVYLMRILRHDPEVRLQLPFLLHSLLPLMLLCLAAGFLSIPAVLAVLKTILYTLYSITLVPLLLGVSYVLGWIVMHTLYPLLQWLASLNTQEEISLELNSAADMLADSMQQEENSNPTAQVILHIVGIVVIVILVLLLLFLLYRKLTGSRQDSETAAEIRQQRTPAAGGADTAPLRIHSPFGADPASRIRRTYRSYLKLCREKGFIPPDSYTSQEICSAADSIFNDPEKDKKAAELRELYIQARYQGNVTSEQARKARELMQELKKE